MTSCGTSIPGLEIVRVASVPAQLEGSVRVGPHSWARADALLRVAPGIGRFLARNGTNIEYMIEPGADVRHAEALLQGALLGALIHQRGELPLHATSLVDPAGEYAIALAGDSGAGKSTTGHAMIARGWTLLSDDLSRVTIEGKSALAWPGRSRLRLLDDACTAGGLDTSALEPAPNWPGKYIVRLPQWPRSTHLRAVFVLDRGAGGLRVDRLSGAMAAQALTRHTYRYHYVAALGRSARHLALVAATAACAQVLRVTGSGSVEEVAAAVERAA